jgi:hypothetical protein
MSEILFPPSFEIFPQLLEIGGGGADFDSGVDGAEKGGQRRAGCYVKGRCCYTYAPSSPFHRSKPIPRNTLHEKKRCYQHHATMLTVADSPREEDLLSIPLLSFQKIGSNVTIPSGAKYIGAQRL